MRPRSEHQHPPHIPAFYIVFDEEFITINAQNTMCMPYNWRELYDYNKKNFLLKENVEILQDPSNQSMWAEWIHFNVPLPLQHTDAGF
mgnify:CR=1 FL=1